MTYEEKKEILHGYRECEAQIKYCLMSIEQYKESKMQAGTQKISAVSFVTGDNKDLSDYIAKLDDLNGNLYSKMLRAIKYKEAVLNWIDMLTDEREKLSLKYKYIHHKSISWIAEEMETDPLSERTVNRLIKNGIKNLPEIDIKLFGCH